MYHENDPSLFQRALDAFWDWRRQALQRRRPAPPPAARSASSSSSPRRRPGLVGALWWRLGTPRRTPTTAGALFDDRPRSAAEHRAAAEAHAAAGPLEPGRPGTHARHRPLPGGTRPARPAPGRTADEAAAEAGRALPAHADRTALRRPRLRRRHIRRPHRRPSRRTTASPTRPRPGRTKPASARKHPRWPTTPARSRRMTTEATAPVHLGLAHRPPGVDPRPRPRCSRFVLLVVSGVAIAALRSGEQHGGLDPRSADPYGSRAVAELLADRGVSTRVVTTLDEAAAAAGPDTTLLVADPDLLTHRQQSRPAHRDRRLRRPHRPRSPPAAASVGTRWPPASARTPPPASTRRSPPTAPCPPPGARAPPTLGGIRYTTTVPGADELLPQRAACPPCCASRRPPGTATPSLLGSPDILYNDRLDEQGNASLALQLLGSRPHLVWYLPSLSDASATDAGRGQRGFLDLLPSGWLWGTAPALLRRRPRRPVARPPTGPARARETPRGRSAPPRPPKAAPASTARPTPATARPPLCAPPPAPASPPSSASPSTQAHAPEALLPAVSAHLHAPATGQTCTSLLFGPAPARRRSPHPLADQLDALEREVRRP